MKKGSLSGHFILFLVTCCFLMVSCGRDHFNQGTADSEEQGQVIIKILKVGDLQKATIDLMVDNFNKEHENVKAEIVAIADSSRMEELYEIINTRISSGEIDLLFLWDATDIWRYQEGNLLEDLMPYLDKSENYSLDRMVPNAIKCFQRDGGLYGLSPYFTIETVGGKASQVGEKAGWTTEEFIAWLREHPECKGEMGLAKDYVLNYFILKGSLNRYVDFDQKKAYFQGNDFRELLQELKELPLDEHWYADTWYEEESKDYERLEWIRWHNSSSYAEMIRNYGEDLTFMGFPTTDGTPCHYMSSTSLSMLGRCKHKEEAWQFMEYVQLHFPEAFAGNEFWMDQDLLEQSLSSQIEVYDPLHGSVTFTLSDHQEQSLRNVISTMKIESLEQRTVWNIIVEEVWPYFNDQKSLDEVCEIIQKRVQLFLSEE